MYDILRKAFPGEVVRVRFRPEWMKNPLTQQELELDFFLPARNLAVEVNGPEHELPTQKIRDSIKARICKERGIQLISTPATPEGLLDACTRFQVRHSFSYRVNPFKRPHAFKRKRVC